jgi:hypothetical protein
LPTAGAANNCGWGSSSGSSSRCVSSTFFTCPHVRATVKQESCKYQGALQIPESYADAVWPAVHLDRFSVDQYNTSHCRCQLQSSIVFWHSAGADCKLLLSENRQAAESDAYLQIGLQHLSPGRLCSGTDPNHHCKSCCCCCCS